MSSKAIEGLIAGIVGCRDDPEPPLMLRWTKGDIVRRNRERRLAAVTDAVAAAAALVKPGQAIAWTRTRGGSGAAGRGKQYQSLLDTKVETNGIS